MLKNLTRLLLACLVVGACKCPVKTGKGDGGEDGGDAGPGCIGDECITSCPGNFRYVWPVSDTAVLAAVPSATDISQTLGELHYVVTEGCVDTKLNDKTFMGSVQVNLTGSPGALFIADGSVDEAKGKVYYVDLSATKPTAAPLQITGPFGGSNVYFGAAGNQILTLVPAALGTPAKTQLTWSNGKATPTVITGNATTLVFSPDRTKAIVADNVSSGKGALLVVDMATGTSKSVVSNATALDSNNQPLFAVAGSTLAFVDDAGALKTVSITDSTSIKIIDATAATPKVAGLSLDGAKIAFLSGTAVKYGSSDATDTPVTIGAVQQSGVAPVRPVISPDGKAVLYFSNVVNRAGLMGTAYLTSTTSGSTRLKVGDNAAVQQYFFGSCGFNVAVVTGLQDLTATATWTGVGTVSRTTPGANCTFAGTTVTNLLPGAQPAATANGVHATDVEQFKSRGYLGFIGGYKPIGDMQLGKAYIAPMGPGDASEIPGKALAGSLESSSSSERLLFVGNTVVDNDGLASGDLFVGFTDGSGSPIITGGVLDAHFTPGGKVGLVVKKDGTSAVAIVNVP